MTCFIGIDIAKLKHDCFIMNQNGEVIRGSFTFQNNKAGFQELLNVLSTLDSMNEIRIGLEATGHYGSNLKRFLEDNQFTFMEIHPILIKRFTKATTLRRTKTDKIDAQIIALYLSTVVYKTYPSKSYHIKNLKSLTRMRSKLMEDRTRYLNNMTNVLDRMFPELKPAFNGKLHSASCLYILEHYGTPSKISRVTQESYKKMKSKLKRPISYAKFIQLKQLAKETIGTEDPILAFQLLSLLQLFKNIDSKIKEIEAFIEEQLSHIDTVIPSIKGISNISAATILAEVGDFDWFDTPAQFLAFAGLEPSTDESGERTASFGKMVKHGSPHLRRTLMNCAMATLLYIPQFYDYYKKKRREGKSHRVALSHVAKKLSRVIFYLEKNHIQFDISKVR